MANKLKKTFSNKQLEHNFNLSFLDKEYYKDFLKVLNTVWEEGNMVTIDCSGIGGFKTSMKDGDKTYPISNIGETLSHFVVGPSPEPFDIHIKNGDKLKTINCTRYHSKNKIFIKIPCGSALNIEIDFFLNSTKTNFSFTNTPAESKDIKEIYKSYETGIVVLETLFKNDSLNKSNRDAILESNLILEWKSILSTMAIVYRKLYEIEKEFKLIFNPKDIVVNTELFDDIEELYELIISKNAVKLRSGFNDITMDAQTPKEQVDDFEVGKEIALGFNGEIMYTISNHKINIYTANVVLNAKIHEVIYNKNNEITRVVYKGSDSNPLSVACTGFKTIQEAENENKEFTKDIDKYINAKPAMHYVFNDVIGDK